MNWFRRITPATLTQQQLQEARLNALAHRAAAEHHLALAEMYEKRAQRLAPVQGVVS